MTLRRTGLIALLAVLLGITPGLAARAADDEAAARGQMVEQVEREVAMFADQTGIAAIEAGPSHSTTRVRWRSARSLSSSGVVAQNSER